MKVAILQCDEVAEKFQPQLGGYGDMIRDMFSLVDGQFSFQQFDCQKEEYPENLHVFDFFITTGSKASVYENKPWIIKLIQFVKILHEKEKKLIGICFGHQIIAMALDGKVEKAKNGWGIGLSSNTVISTPDWMTKKRSELKILVSHQDQITVLPENAQIIATSEFCPYFLVQWNNHFLSTQGHPEWSKKYSEALITDRRGTILPEECASNGLDSLSGQPDIDIFAQWIVDFVTSN